MSENNENTPLALPVPVFIESPYAGQIERNLAYARECLIHSIAKGEAPFLSHLIYTQVLDDTIYVQRLMGLRCAASFRAMCKILAVYTDLGISPGMLQGINHARELGLDIQMRRIYNG